MCVFFESTEHRVESGALEFFKKRLRSADWIVDFGESGEWGVESGEWGSGGVESGCRVECGGLRVQSTEWRVVSGVWWRVESGEMRVGELGSGEW